MNPYFLTGINQAKKNPIVTLLLVLALVFVLYKGGQKIGLIGKTGDRENGEKYHLSGAEPDSFSKTIAVNLADRFHNSFHYQPFARNGVGYKKEKLKAVLGALQSVNDVEALSDAFGKRNAPDCLAWCQKLSFGGFLSFVNESLLDDYPVLRQANLN